jgi:hypothetical protein
MQVKLYWGIWIVGILIVGGFYLTGNFTPIAAVVFGFMSFGMVFMGMMSVLPSTITHTAHENDNIQVPLIHTKPEAVLSVFREFRKSWMPYGVEVRRPRYR